MDRDTTEVVRASEIGHYVYCARAWWLGQVKGYEPIHPELMARGTAFHLAHGRAVESYRVWQRWAYVLLSLSALTALWLLWHLAAATL